ncbi:MAG: diacylglycerol kinase family lipid kinase [Solirubrobacterales bacterium]|nr:diacylglycerol kinase family lipid kinase [Solirubrobacterales bacterium]
MPRRLALIVNPSSGGGRALKALPAVEADLRARGLEFHTTHTRSLSHGRELALRAADAGEVAVTLSGDGLLGAVAGALRGREDAIIGVLPGGRGNDFARVCGIPLEPVEACAVLAEGEPRPVDVGDVGGRTFVGIASLGFDSDANRIANEAPSWLGNLVYAYGALRALATWRHATFEVVVDGRARTLSGWSVAAANSGAYGGGMLLAPEAKLDDGLLDVVTTSASSKLVFLRGLPKVFKGTHVELDNVEVVQGAEVRISADRPFVVYADGDPIGELPVTIRAVPGAIRVLLPA